MKLYQVSSPLLETDHINEEPIYIIYQYFVPSSTRRQLEYKHCLHKNVNNEHIRKIYLLNERIYTNDELGITSDKIIQKNIGKRLSYRDVFDFVEKEKISGYIVFMNADIYVTDSIKNLKKSNIHEKKTMIALLRYDLTSMNTLNIFGPRSDSQDTWIYHSNFNPSLKERTVFNFFFGKPGCDNKFAYLSLILGYKVINCPLQIQTCHVHMSQERNYSAKDLIGDPYYHIEPYGYTVLNSNIAKLIGIYNITDRYTKYTFKDNDVLRSYIEKCKNPFIIPRIAGIENQFAFIGTFVKNKRVSTDIANFVKERAPVMKNNAGIKLTTFNDVEKYSDMYLNAFKNSEMYTVWEPHGNVYSGISQSHDYITDTFKKEQVWAFTFDIFHYIHLNPWTLALKGKKILIISAFIESIKEKIPIREKIYGIDLFPECEFVFCKPPQTNGTNPSRVFDEELRDFMENVKTLDFDVALVSCGGYGNLVCNEIYEMGKSAIYVGGVLQMYFGVYGQRWMRERKDIMNLYMNQYWSRPKEEERPSNYKNIEGNCYW
jgi:hypothetical protein